MAIAKTYSFAALLLSIFFLSLTLLPLQSGMIGIGESAELKTKMKMKMALGSRPPPCVNRCMSCRPCEATLVILSHKRGTFVKSSHAEDATYYLLSWKCTCGNKLYQP